VKCDFSYRHSNARNNSNSEPEGFNSQVKIRGDIEQSYCKQIVSGFFVITNLIASLSRYAPDHSLKNLLSNVIFCKGDKIFTFVCSYFIAEDVNIM
jgi:hypothetical protein